MSNDLPNNMPSQLPRAERPPAKPRAPVVPLDQVEAAIRSIQHGVVQIIIQDGHVIQIEKTEKIRLK